jgi:hypothetical protein
MLAGVYPCGLEIGAPPDLVSVGPVLPRVFVGLPVWQRRLSKSDCCGRKHNGGSQNNDFVEHGAPPWPTPNRQKRFRSTSARFAQPARVGFHPAEGRTQRSVDNRSRVLRHGCEIKWTHDHIGSDPQKYFVSI